MREWFLYSSVLEQTESNLSKINWFRCIILLHSNSIGVLEHIFTVSHSYQTYFSFLGSYLNLDCRLCDHMIMRFASRRVRLFGFGGFPPLPLGFSLLHLLFQSTLYPLPLFMFSVLFPLFNFLLTQVFMGADVQGWFG